MHTEEKKHHHEHAPHEHKEEHVPHESTHQVKTSDSIQINKKIAGAVLIVAILLGAAYYGKAGVLAATVNGSPITRLEVMSQLERASGKAYVETLVTEKLIMDAGRSKGVAVTDEDVAKEIARIETSLVAQGATIDMLLASQGLTLENLKKQLTLKQVLEALLAEKVAVTDAEVDAYIVESKITVDSAKSAEIRSGIMEQLRGQKLNKEAGAYIEGLRASARIVFYGNYRTAPAPVPTTP